MGIWQRLTGSGHSAPAPAQKSEGPVPKHEMNDHGADSTKHNQKEKTQMQEDLITAENLSPELLKSVFDAAFMETKLDADGEIIVQDEVKVRVQVNQERKDRVRLLSAFGFKSDSQPLARLQCANQINAEYIMVCASAEEDILFFRYDLLVAGGVTKKALVMAVKRFASIPQGAVTDHGKEIVK